MTDTIDEKLLRETFAAQGKSFRGSVLEFIKDAPMGKGHGNDGKPFNIETACYLKPVFAEYDKAKANNTRLLMCLLAGVKTMKSFASEVMAGDHVCNCAGDFAVFFATESVASVGSTTRIVEYLKGIPQFAKKCETIINRHGDAKGALKFPDKTLFLLSANKSNTQQKNLGGLTFQDAFLSERSGMIAEMLARTTQYQKEAIIILESQGGETGYDFDSKYLETDQRELHVICPCCGQPHIFNWKAFDASAMRRMDDFVPTPPLIIPSLDHAAWVEHHRPLMLDESRRIAGFQRGDESVIKRPDGSYNETAIRRETHFRCFHCDGIWRDDGEFGVTRIALDKSSHYVPTNPDAIKGNVGFNFPQWINRRLPWGEMMLEKLQAQRAMDESDNQERIKIWWQKVAAKTWDEKIGRVSFTPSFVSIDPALTIPNEAGRGMSVDCQKSQLVSAQNPEVKGGMTGEFWVAAHAWDKSGCQQQLWRGYCTTWDEWIAKAKELKIPAYNIVVDGRFKLDEVLNRAAANAELMDETDGNGQKTGRRFYITWTILMGDSYRSWRHEDGYYRDYSPSKRESVPVNFNGSTIQIEVNIIRWSNHRFKDQVIEILQNTALKISGKATLTALPVRAADPKDKSKFLLSDKTIEMEVDTGQHQRTWESQMASNVRTVHPKTRMMEIAETHKDPHYFDCVCGILYLMKRQGLLGAIATPEQSAPSA